MVAISTGETEAQRLGSSGALSACVAWRRSPPRPRVAERGAPFPAAPASPTPGCPTNLCGHTAQRGCTSQVTRSTQRHPCGRGTGGASSRAGSTLELGDRPTHGAAACPACCFAHTRWSWWLPWPWAILGSARGVAGLAVPSVVGPSGAMRWRLQGWTRGPGRRSLGPGWVCRVRVPECSCGPAGSSVCDVSSRMCDLWVCRGCDRAHGAGVRHVGRGRGASWQTGGAPTVPVGRPGFCSPAWRRRGSRSFCLWPASLESGEEPVVRVTRAPGGTSGLLGGGRERAVQAGARHAQRTGGVQGRE